MEETDIIDNYIWGSLKGDELLKFEATLKTDPSLQLLVRIRKAIISGIEESYIEELKRKLIAYEHQLEKTKPAIGKNFIKLAALAVILVGIGIGTYYAIHNYFTTKYARFDIPEIGLPNNMSADRNDIQFENAMTEFKLKNYLPAYKQFSSILKRQPLNDTLLYFTGISAYRSGNYEEGIHFFEKVVLNKVSVYKEISEYRIGICLLEKGDKINAKVVFSLIALNPKHQYSSQARNVLKYAY